MLKRPKRRKFPRVPLPRQTEKIHVKKSKDRKVKHKKRDDAGDGF